MPLDRIGLVVEVQPASVAELARAPGGGQPPPWLGGGRGRASRDGSAGEDGPASNAEADPREMALHPDALALGEQAIDRLRVSPRGYTRVLGVARTIADPGGGRDGAARRCRRGARVSSPHAGPGDVALRPVPAAENEPWK